MYVQWLYNLLTTFELFMTPLFFQMALAVQVLGPILAFTNGWRDTENIFSHLRVLGEWYILQGVGLSLTMGFKYGVSN